MGRQSIVPEILAVLEPWLKQKVAAYIEQAEEERQPTLPVTKAGKVNVRAITAELGLRSSQEQHFYRHPALYEPVNQVAAEQGVKFIKSRDDTENEYRLDPKMRQLERRVSELERQNASLRVECGALRERLKRLSHMEFHMISTGRMPR